MRVIKKYAKWGLLLGASVQMCSVFAQSGTYLFDETPIRGVLTLILGPEFIHNNQTRTLDLYPSYQNRYVANGRWGEYLNRGALLGVETPLGTRSHVQIGISGYTSNLISMKGYVWQYGLPNFNNLNYRYQIGHHRVMLAGKLLGFNEDSCWHPYLLGEVGVAFNHASNYSEIPRVSTAVASIPLTRSSKTALTYSAGLGLEYAVTEQIRLSVGYQLTDLGKINLGLSPLQTTLATYHLSNLYANEVRLQFSVIV